MANIAPGYVPGHSVIIAYQIDTAPSAAITESSNGVAAATISAVPSAPVAIGYTNVPGFMENLNNRHGFAAGAPTALYRVKGSRQPSAQFDVRLGVIPLLTAWLAGTSVSLFFGINGSGASTVMRCCYGSTLGIRIANGGAQEIIGSVAFEGVCLQTGPTLSYSAATIASLGVPLCYHDVRTVDITTNGGVANNFRMGVSALDVNVTRTIERGSVRPETTGGDTDILARTADPVPLNIAVAGNARFFTSPFGPDFAPYFRATADASFWGTSNTAVGISIPIRDRAATAGHIFDLSLYGVTPTSRGAEAAEVNALVQHGVPFSAANLVIGTT